MLGAFFAYDMKNKKINILYIRVKAVEIDKNILSCAVVAHMKEIENAIEQFLSCLDLISSLFFNFFMKPFRVVAAYIDGLSDIIFK